MKLIKTEEVQETLKYRVFSLELTEPEIDSLIWALAEPDSQMGQQLRQNYIKFFTQLKGDLNGRKESGNETDGRGQEPCAGCPSRKD